MTAVIMIQGTMSHVGKSVLTAGICRVLYQEGFTVAPFKSQNMALNSYITDDGLEIGRAQAVQAEACGLRPEAAMNPILLKPTSERGSQVILHGEVFAQMRAAEYFARKSALMPEVLRAYESLAQRFEIVVVEGAGSPAEINLRQNDIVNMGLAERIDAPVLLVGDIDRGGVFAQLAGTLLLLSEAEQKRVRALVINKFRGDPALLQPGLAMLTERVHKPFAGVVPWLDIDIEDEDSLSERLGRRQAEPPRDGQPLAKTAAPRVDIAVIRLPQIANFTDFAPLETVPQFGVRFVRRPEELGRPDLLLLPGSKNTLADLAWLRRTGLAQAICALAAAQTPILGICGGYQMLGRRILDPIGVEGGGQADGLGLLPVETTFAPRKQRVQTSGRLGSVSGALAALSGAALTGYEIHMGQSQRQDGASPLLLLDPDRPDGCQHGHVYGTYLHGFFDSQACRAALLQAFGRSGETPPEDYRLYRLRQYDLLADSLRQSLDWPLIWRIIRRQD